MALPLEPNSIEPHPGRPAVRYRALAPLAIASMVLGVLSPATALSWTLFPIPMAGAALGWLAQRRIRRAPDEWVGLGLARVGLALSVASWVFGFCWLLFARGSEVPPGYARITYEMLQPDPQKPTQPVPQSALDMQDKKVFMQGYMMPSRRQTGIKEFILSPTNGECQFCSKAPRPTEKVRVILQGDLETVFTTHLVRIAGRFRVDAENAAGVPYGIEADWIH